MPEIREMLDNFHAREILALFLIKVDNVQCSVENMRRTSMDNNNNNKIKNCKYNIKCNAVIDYIDKNNSPGEDVSQDNSNNKAITTTKIFHVFVSSSFKSFVSF